MLAFPEHFNIPSTLRLNLRFCSNPVQSFVSISRNCWAVVSENNAFVICAIYIIHITTNFFSLSNKCFGWVRVTSNNFSFLRVHQSLEDKFEQKAQVLTLDALLCFRCVFFFTFLLYVISNVHFLRNKRTFLHYFISNIHFISEKEHFQFMLFQMSTFSKIKEHFYITSFQSPTLSVKKNIFSLCDFKCTLSQQ